MSPFIKINKYENTIIKDGENDKYGYSKDFPQFFSKFLSLKQESG